MPWELSPAWALFCCCESGDEMAGEEATENVEEKKKRPKFWDSFPTDLFCTSRCVKYSLYFGAGAFFLYGYSVFWASWLVLYSLVLAIWIGYKIFPVMWKAKSLEMGKWYAVAGFYLMLAPMVFPFIYANEVFGMERLSWIGECLLCFIGVLSLYVVIFHRYIKKGFAFVPFGIAIASYAVLLLCGSNVVFDRSPGEYKEIIIYKISHYSRRDNGHLRHTYSAYIDLKDYGGYEKEKIKISKEEYEKYDNMTGEKTMLMRVHPGLFNQPWLEIVYDYSM